MPRRDGTWSFLIFKKENGPGGGTPDYVHRLQCTRTQVQAPGPHFQWKSFTSEAGLQISLGLFPYISNLSEFLFVE